MPPKQQATLNKFFGGSAAANPPKVQSKLRYSTKAESEKENDTSPPSSSNAKKEESDVDMKDVEATAADEEDAVKSEDERVSPAPSKSRKRTPEETAESEEEEPPAKKMRSKKSSTNQTQAKDTMPTKKKRSAKAKALAVEEDDEEELPTRGRKQVLSAPKDDELSDEAEAQSEHEEVSEEEEQPVKPAKSAKQIQTTLTASGKDPYPDWKQGESVPYAALCTTFSKIELTTKRLEISAHCSLFLRQVLRLTPTDLLPTVLLMINKLAADYAGIELGIGESLIMKAIGETTGRSLADIKADQNKIGDLGLVAAKSRSNQPTMFKPKPLTVRGVHEGLKAIATIEGHGSQGKKVGAIKKILSAADVDLVGKDKKGVDITHDKGGPSESKYIVRTLEGKLRIGLAEKTVLVALAHAMVAHEVALSGDKVPSTEQITKGEGVLKTVYSELPSYEVIVPAMLDHGIFHLRENCKLQPGVPLKPMLAKPTKSITEVLDRFENKEFTCEYKYDGERAQIHFVSHDSPQQFQTTVPQAGKTSKGIANIFSRNSEDLSKKYPDVLAKLPTWVKNDTKSFVLDCESVAWDVEEKKVLPFQQLMTRKRKDVKADEIKVKVCIFAFDLLFLNGEALVNKSFRERRAALEAAFQPVEGEFAFAQYGDTNNLEEIQNLLEESVKASCEGLMVKMLDGPESSYEPSKRSQNWLKVKKDYLSGVGDSLDLVVLGAYYGKGKRTNWFGAFLLACYNSSTETYESVCNIGTGFSEANLEAFHSSLSEMTIDKPKPFYDHSTGNKDQPDVWFEPRVVWEVRTADLTLSPRYRAAASETPGHKGVSLRFPRFIRVRDDKKPDEATESRRVAEMYRKQESVTKNKGPSVDDDFEY